MKTDYEMTYRTFADAENAVVWQMVTPNTWAPCFATNKLSLKGDRFHMERLDFHLSMRIASSGLGIISTVSGPVDYALFIVTLKKANARYTINRTQDLSALTDNTDYITQVVGNTEKAQWRLNPDVYNIKATRRGLIGNYTTNGLFVDDPAGGTATRASTIADTHKRHIIPITHKRTLTNGGIGSLSGLFGATEQEWTTVTGETSEPDDRIYVLMFNNTPTGTEVDYFMSVIVHGHQPAL